MCNTYTQQKHLLETFGMARLAQFSQKFFLTVSPAFL